MSVLEAVEGEEQQRIRLGLTRYLGLLYSREKFTYLSYYATVADLPSVFL